MASGEVHTDNDALSPCIVVTISGEVDLSVAPEMEKHLSAALERGRDIIADMSEASFIDSVALSALTLTLERVDEAGLKLYLILSDPRVLRTFHLTGLDSHFSIFHSRVDLVKELNHAKSA